MPRHRSRQQAARTREEDVEVSLYRIVLGVLDEDSKNSNNNREVDVGRGRSLHLAFTAGISS
eukprot:scaffold344989_cov34-Attheya_sp.AAC.1